MPTLSIRTLEPDDAMAAVGLLTHLNPDCPTDVLRRRFTEIIEEHGHYRIIGAFMQSKLVGVAGVWIATKIWCGRYLEVDNLVVHPLHRSEGIGSALFTHLESLAEEEKCNLLVLDSYTSNYPSHRLYHRLGYEIWGYHFVKPVGDLNR